MTKRRQRAGEENPAELLKQTGVTAVEREHWPERELTRVNVDAAVQEKHITHSGGRRTRIRCISRL